MKSFLSFINIDFLVKKDSIQNWKMIVYLSLLALITIYSGHSTDRKIFKAAALKKEINILNNEFVSTRISLMNIKMESKVTKRLSENCSSKTRKNSSSCRGYSNSRTTEPSGSMRMARPCATNSAFGSRPST